MSNTNDNKATEKPKAPKPDMEVIKAQQAIKEKALANHQTVKK